VGEPAEDHHPVTPKEADMAHEPALRELLSHLLDWDNAHLRFDDAVNGFPPALRGVRPPGAPHSGWELLEHLRIALWDIVEFSRDAKHVSPPWPSGYWPTTPAPPNDKAWDESAKAYRASLQTLASMARDERTDLYARIPHGDGQTLLREILLAADHNAYHLGQLVMVRRMVT
jgi:hypothetical protein